MLISTVPTKTQLSNFLGTPGEDYFKGNPKGLNFYFLVIWWGKSKLLKLYLGVSKNRVVFPQNHPFVHRVFHYFYHPFWGYHYFWKHPF